MKDNSKMGSSDSLLETIRTILEKKHTTPETPKEKSLAKLAHPKDKITHKDVLVGRGVLKKENSGDRMGVIVGTRKEKVELDPKLKEEEQVDERKLTGAEAEKKEKYVMSLKGKMGGFKKRYGERAKEVMYATATKMAKEEVELDETKLSPEDFLKGARRAGTGSTDKLIASLKKKRSGPGSGTVRKLDKAELKRRTTTAKEEVQPVAEVSTGLANRYLSKTQGDDKRQAGRALALKKKWGGKVGGTEAPKVPTKD